MTDAIKTAEDAVAVDPDTCYGGVKHRHLGDACPKCAARPNEMCGYIGAHYADLEAALRSLLTLAKDQSAARARIAALTTVTEDDVEAVARAIFRCGFALHEDESIVAEKWREWERDREMAFKKARAALAAFMARKEG